MNTLVINCGSSSIKFALIDESDHVLISGKHERLLDAEAAETVSDGRTHEDAIADILRDVDGFTIDIVGHRIVHGGSRHAEPCLIDESVLADIERHVPDAPMHNPYSLAAIRAVRQVLSDIPQVAMFDTAFHARMPRRSTSYAIDHEVAQKYDIRRYGFHGISHEYAAGIAAGFLQRPLNELRLITLHLGNGASACAVEFGRSAETSMGNTPLEGLVMGTRSGDVDAGVLLSLLRHGYDVNSLDELLNKRSGLAGLSGLGNDLREIERAAADGDDRARLAINVFAHRARKYIGAYAAAMGGVDAIVFTGGIGENSASMRGRILQRLEFLGVVLDEDRNRDASIRHDDEHALITTPRSRVEAIVVKTNEELMIAQQARRVVSATKPATLKSIPIAVSGRHCHLTAATFEVLFGKGATPTLDKPLSQPGQFACKERVNLIGPRDRIDGVRVLGPLRTIDQVEISRTDEFRLGIDAPVRNSGNIAGSAPITLEGPAGTVNLPEGLICARRHIHMHPDDAAGFGVADKDEVAVSIVGGDRDLVFGDVLVRVSDSFVLEMHIDTDEANAALLNQPTIGALSTVDVDEVQDGPVADVTGSLIRKTA